MSVTKLKLIFYMNKNELLFVTALLGNRWTDLANMYAIVRIGFVG